eukprot:CAMPEP_0181526836 /NCGR_PEP_ID=MMETSP1110-20121109/69693_1 /TAXON_ID=174948 /ORGANISM="Symbiodinium sp., Strain CCMP421" /LENGTH=282 /DNA_ID=CAMNT_0023657693 /DNA_START=1 /DNA_END=846 /DNA_ORIENTATION=-
MDSKIVELQTIADRDFQLDDKALRKAEEKGIDDFYAKLWYEGYLAKIEREEREKGLKEERNDQQKKTLGIQLDMKRERLEQDKAEDAIEAERMKKLWAQQEVEEKEAVVQHRVQAKEERRKADEYMAIQQAQRAEEERMEKELEELLRLQDEESERQWQKRYAQWEKEELARRSLMEEVYHDRAEQVKLKHQLREQVKTDIAKERGQIEEEMKRLEEIEKQREEGEKLVSLRHQEELFRQMDFHQVCQLQQHAIEQRQAAIAEEKIRRAVEQEKKKANAIMT